MDGKNFATQETSSFLGNWRSQFCELLSKESPETSRIGIRTIIAANELQRFVNSLEGYVVKSNLNNSK